MTPESPGNRVPQEVFKSDFDLGFYGAENLNADVVETHVRTFFGEKLMKPRREKLWVGKDGTLDPDYVAMMEKSINYWKDKGDDRSVERFEKELEGARNAVSLIISSSDKFNSPLPIVLNASDPGDFYVDKEGRKKSVTFIWIKESSEEEGWHYNVYSLPTPYIGLEKHWDLLKRFGDIQQTQDILSQIFNEEDLSSNSLIAFPVLLTSLIEGLDVIAQELGYPSWNEIDRVASDQLAMENDKTAKERREKIVIEFSARIFYAVKDKRPREYQEALVEAMSDTMAIEAGKRDYLGKNASQIEEEIDKNVRLALALKYKVFEKNNYSQVKDLGLRLGDLRALHTHYGWMQDAFATNPFAREARSTGCGGSGMNYGHSFGRDFLISMRQPGMESLFADQASNYAETMTTFEDSSTDGEEPDGRYEEGVYKPGHCRACNKDRKKVWHKSDGGCDCCTTCEHRLAGGA